jgi:chromosomal replication initiation ATPase DnaA
VELARGLAIDDADRVADEAVLLHLLNRARDEEAQVLIASRSPPSRWPISLPDLASRLRAVTTVRIGPAEPELLRALLFRLLADRRLKLPETLQARMLLRLPRTAAALRDAVDQLDAVAWQSGGRISRSDTANVFAAGQTDEHSATLGVPTSPSE